MPSKQAIVESVKEFLRVVVLAVIPVLIGGLEGGMIDWRLAGVVGAIAGLRFVDKLLHEMGKERSTARTESVLTKGITRF